MAIDATVGGASANSYVTLDEADDYFAGRLNAGGWTDAADNREAALITATRVLDRESFEGVPVNPLNGTSTGTTQALKWPRYSADDDADHQWLPTTIPQIVKDATCEIALWLVNQGTTDPMQPTGLEGFRNVRIGNLDVTPERAADVSGLPPHIRRLLAPVLVGGQHTVRLYRS